MKLYATTTSERASKGQGGNERMDIILTIDKIPVAKILCGKYKDGEYSVDYYTDMREGADFTHGIIVKSMENSKIKGVMTEQLKGKSQKGEHSHKWTTDFGKPLTCECGAIKIGKEIHD